MAATDIDWHLELVRNPAGEQLGVIAIHSTARGPAMGGCRVWAYEDDRALVSDAMRLARAMSFKNALAGLPFGGGKAVLRRWCDEAERAQTLNAFAKKVQELEGKYITAEDVGTNVNDMLKIREHTSFVAGLPAVNSKAGGDPSLSTARGVFRSIEAVARVRLGKSLSELTVAVQGLGHVGSKLCAMLASAGVRLLVADSNSALTAVVAARDSAIAIDPGEICSVRADIFAPCALGAVLNASTIPTLRVNAVVGAANNQLSSDADGDALSDRGILYAPDYVVNAGGIINVAAEYLGESTETVEHLIDSIPHRLLSVLEQADGRNLAPHRVVDEMAGNLVHRHMLQVA